MPKKIVSLSNVAPGTRDDLRAVLLVHGPNLLGLQSDDNPDGFPVTPEGAAATTLTNPQVEQVVDAVVRNYLRAIVAGHRADQAAEKARADALAKPGVVDL